MGTLEPLARAGLDIAALDIDLGAELLETLEVQVHRPVADGAASRQ